MRSPSTNNSQDNEAFLRTASTPEPQQAFTADQVRHAVKNLAPETNFNRDGLVSGIDKTVMDQLSQWNHFCALALRIDPPAADNPPEGLHKALAQLLQKAAQIHGIIDCRWQHDLYLCAIPTADTALALPMADHLQNGLARQRIESITIGIAPFPLMAYDRSQTTINACKAMDHAAFFGPGSIVLFDAVSLNISGDYYYQTGEMDLALAEYRAALQLDSANVNVLNSLGVCLAKNGDLEAAQSCFENILQQAPAESMAIYNLGMIHLLMKDPQQAITCFLNAFTFNSKTFEIPFQIGKLYLGQGECKKALTYLEKAIELSDKHGVAHRLRGQCLTSLGKTSAAVAAYKLAVKRNPNDAVALSALGLLYDKRNENHDVCEVFLKQSIDLAPENGLFRHRLACLYQKHRKLDRALERYKEAEALGHDSCKQIAEVRRQVRKG